MSKIIPIILFVFITYSVQAQKVSYEKLDSISQYISKRQFAANNKSYSEINRTVEVSFPKQNFRVLYSNLSATNSIFKKSGNREVTELTENIDLSEVTFITIVSDENDFFVYRLEFPANSIERQIYEDGKFKEKQNVSEVYLYAANTKWDFYNELVKLCHLLKNQKNKGGDEYNIEAMSKDWLDAKAKNSVLGYQIFVNKYPLSLYSKETWVLLDARKKILQDEADRLENIRLEKIRIEQQAAQEKRRVEQEAEKERLRIEAERQAVIAEKEARNIEFFAFRAGYVMPNNEDSQKVSGTPSPILESPALSPYETGQFGLKSGFNAGFTGIINLEFINKNMPSWIGIGIPMDFNVAMMQYNWDEISSATSVNGFTYQDAKYSLWGIASIGAGLSVSFHPAANLFIDFLGRADYAGTFGGDYKAVAKSGANTYAIKTERGEGSDADSFGLAKTAGINIRYKSIMIGVEMKKDIIDKAKFTERVDDYGSYPIKNPGLNLDYMQFTLGYIF